MGPMSAVLVRGRRPWANTADRGPMTGPIRNYLINDNFIINFIFEKSIETRLPCLYGLEKQQDMMSSLLAVNGVPLHTAFHYHPLIVLI